MLENGNGYEYSIGNKWYRFHLRVKYTGPIPIEFQLDPKLASNLTTSWLIHVQVFCVCMRLEDEV